MRNEIRFAITVLIALIGVAPGGQAVGQQLLSGFENTLNSTANRAWEGQWTVNPEYSSTGATEGTSALVLHHAPTWVTEGTVLKAGLPLAQQVSQHDFLLIDVTTTDLGVAGDGWSPSWRQVFVIFNSNRGGWMQNQIDFPVAADDGTSFTHTAVLDLATTGIKANAQAYVTDPGTDPHWELFLIFQGGDQGTAIKAGDYNSNNVVDAADYSVWRKNLGNTTLPNETVSPGIVDQADYDEWRKSFGADYSKLTTIIDNIRFANAGAGAEALGPSAVPEPSAALLAIGAALAAAGGSKRRR